MKIKTIRLANQITVGSKHFLFAENTDYEITLENSVLVRIKDKRTQAVTFTSLFNTIFFVEDTTSKDKKA